MSENKTVNVRDLVDTYEFPCVLAGSGQKLLIKPITTGQMKKILIYEEESDPYVIEDVLDRLISDCVVSEGFDIDDLYLQDRFSLLLEIRRITKGDSYTFNWKCPKCGIENIKTLKLSELKNVPINVTDNVIKVGEQIKLEVDFPTRRDQKDAIERMNKKGIENYQEKQLDVQTGTFANCIKRVHTPNGILEDVSFEDKYYILDNIASESFKIFSDWFVDHDFGIEFEVPYTCTHCDYSEKGEIPLTDFFT
jgi:predicted nucleic-acid-binding Zn-ribbon protein